jgi:5'-deoxynucleotidase
VELPDYYPPLDFEVDSVWQSAPFGDRGKALLYMSAVTDGSFSFRVYLCQYVYQDCPNREGMRVHSFAATAVSAGECAAFTLEKPRSYVYQDEKTGETKELEVTELIYAEDMFGNMSIDGDELKLSYEAKPLPGTEFQLSGDEPCCTQREFEDTPTPLAVYFPTEFTRLADAQAGQAMYAMPLYYSEIVLPPYTEKTERYYLEDFTFHSEDAACFPEIRGMKIGDSLASVLSRFVCEPERARVVLPDGSGGGAAVIYGSQELSSNYAGLVYENAKPVEIYWWVGIRITIFWTTPNASAAFCFTAENINMAKAPLPLLRRGIFCAILSAVRLWGVPGGGNAVNDNFFALISRMRYITRWGLMRNSVSENIQEHSHMVAVIAHALGVIRRDVLGLPADPNALAAAALFHDAGEILTGDLPTPIKYHSGEITAAYHAVEDLASEKLLSMLPVEMQSAYAPLLTGNVGDYEKRLLKAADRISAYVKCVEERKAGNNEFLSAEKQTRGRIADMALPEADYFMEHFIPAFEKNLDELGMMEEKP